MSTTNCGPQTPPGTNGHPTPDDYRKPEDLRGFLPDDTPRHGPEPPTETQCPAAGARPVEDPGTTPPAPISPSPDPDSPSDTTQGIATPSDIPEISETPASPPETQPTTDPVSWRPLAPVGTSEGGLGTGSENGHQSAPPKTPVGGFCATPRATPPAPFSEMPFDYIPQQGNGWYADAQDGENPETLPSLADRVQDPYSYLHLPPTQWYVPGMIAIGLLTLLYGPPKSGKSTLLAAMLRALSMGGEFLGHEVQPIRTLLLSEMRPEAIRSQMVAAGDTIPTDRRGVLLAKDCQGLNPAQLTDALLTLCRETDDPPQLLVIDTLGMFYPMEAGESGNDYSSTNRQMEHLHRLADGLRDIGAAAVSTHHSRKTDGTGAQAVLGSSALSAAFDVLCQLKVDNKGNRTLGFTTRVDDHLMPALGTLMFDEGIAKLEAKGAGNVAEKDISKSTAWVQGLILVAVNKGAETRSQVQADYPGMDVSKSQYNRLLEDLVAKGLLSAAPSPGKETRYALTAQGTAHASGRGW